jgi:hypothetical protein
MKGLFNLILTSLWHGFLLAVSVSVAACSARLAAHRLPRC